MDNQETTNITENVSEDNSNTSNNVEEKAVNAAEAAVDLTTTAAQEPAETAAQETETEEANEQDTENADSKNDTAKKVKIGIVIAGAVFILFAAVYAASVMGGRTNSIPVEVPDVLVVEEPEVTPEAKPTEKPVEIVIEEEPEEETAQDSLVAIMPGNRRYDECVYADGGVVIVKKGELFGAMDYEGKEIVPVKYAEIVEEPTAGGRFVLANSIVESVTEEKDGATLSYEETITTYTLFDNKGSKVYEGNSAIYTSDDVYLIGIEDKDDIRKNRIEYYRYDGKNKAFMVIYVKDTFSMNGFIDGKTVVYGFTAVPTEDQDTNPTNLVCGIMDEKGNVKWFTKAPGMDEFSTLVAQWKEENKALKTTATKKKKSTKTQEVDTVLDEDGNVVTEDGQIIEDNSTDDEEDEDTEDEAEELTAEEIEEVELTEEELETIEEEADLSNGPVFHMDNILNAPNHGYFVCKDIYDVKDPYSFYDEKGLWLADLDTSFMKGDAKKGFVTGNFNNGSVSVAKYTYNGQQLSNYGSCMVLHIDSKDVLVDVSKAKGMTADTIKDRIVIAVHDDIVISDSDYWMYRDGDKCGYIDHNGKEMKLVYDDATPFVDSIALVVKDGKAIIINDKFEELEEIGDASSVMVSGDVRMVLKDGVTKNYILKSVKEDPLGKNQSKNEDKEDPKAATPAAEEKKTNKKSNK